ncbi:MBL fold metallo-hydrolase [Candidatus Leptofilum sp.]|uniref:MBL fold metallo-hydrolase n=1 Tax=Candidatus Leptofilum sp. TaxID=3241576 RepID=UPI003B5C7A1E
MTHFICKTCGTQFPATAVPPANCPICEDERQYIGWEGQQWTTLAELQSTHHNKIEDEEPNLTGIGTVPNFAIAQRALLVQTPQGNLLWDCISLLDDETKTAVTEFGGIDAIAISHPHYYSSMIEWAHAFDAAIYLHAADQQWVMRPDPAIQFWEGETKTLWDGLTLIRGGGHFAGGTMLHWPADASGAGALLTGDIIQVVSDRRWVSFMYSYPNYIPLPIKKAREIVTAVSPYSFDRIYGAWWDRIVKSGAKTAVTRSAERYIAALSTYRP